ncbi:uncharacterized protein [Bemisia tabaci]|uniref:uncharacterized protein n=1 Tax=Bemisia tabaci TaxID=7038 RepID=UPI003B282295
MFRNSSAVSTLHILGIGIYLILGINEFTEAARVPGKREAETMDCAMVGALGNSVCVMLTPMPEDTGVRATLLIGGRQIVSGMFTGRNPPPFPCIPILVPITTAACLQQRDVRLTSDGFQTCPEAAIINVAVIRFRCINVGRGGVSFQTVNTPNTNGGAIEIDL